MDEHKVNRRKLREKALQVLYAAEFNWENLEFMITDIFTEVEDEKGRDFGIELIRKVTYNKTLLDEKLKKRIQNWEMSRVSLIDKILLYMAVAEFLFFPEIPAKVSINEVIEIAKIYSTEKSSRFINGILDSIYNELKKDNELNKTGRGLIDKSKPN
ncbi:MAG: transcription antitermination factor NusB [Ignavibacteriales bacterium]|nr:transcription antitermination factor NusB [Ignavibacteriales bacterium]